MSAARVVSCFSESGRFAVMTLVGLSLGRAAVKAIPIRSDLLSGVSLITAAIVLPLVFA